MLSSNLMSSSTMTWRLQGTVWIKQHVEVTNEWETEAKEWEEQHDRSAYKSGMRSTSSCAVQFASSSKSTKLQCGSKRARRLMSTVETTDCDRDQRMREGGMWERDSAVVAKVCEKEDNLWESKHDFMAAKVLSLPYYSGRNRSRPYYYLTGRRRQ